MKRRESHRSRRRSRRRLLRVRVWTPIAIAVPIALGGLAPAPATAQTTIDPALIVEPYADGFTSPSFFRFLPGPVPGPIEFLIGEIGTGRILHYRDGVQVGVAVDLAVAYLFERGLFGLALHPDFGAQPWVYAYYTASATGSDTNTAGGALENRVVRMHWNGVVLDSLQILMQLPVGPNHNGGALAFGPDGMLYGSIGEAGTTAGQMQNIAAGTPADRTSMIFRLAPDGSAPADNPFAALGGAMAPVFAYGMRNVFGLDFDPVSGVLWATDNGAALYDEIDRIAPGANGGWLRISGPVIRDAEGVADLWVAPGSAYLDPAFSFRQSFGITAVHFQRGPALGEHYDGDLFVAAHNSMTVYRFDVSADRMSLVMPDSALDDLVADTLAERDRVLWATDVGVVTDIETGPDGALYVLRYSGHAVLHRISRRTTSGAGVVEAVDERRRLVVWPNPSRGPMRIGLPLAGAQHAAGPVRIVDAAGRLVRELHAGSGLAVEWDGRDRRGARIAAGTYFVLGSEFLPVRIVRLD